VIAAVSQSGSLSSTAGGLGLFGVYVLILIAGTCAYFQARQRGMARNGQLAIASALVGFFAAPFVGFWVLVALFS
jgi:hypothetical protein